ncbi:glycosyltransferase family 2 protein [Spirosoma harenae]
MFSIVIPLYNKVHYINKAIASVFAQTFQDFELLIINDGSTDDSLKVASKYVDSRLSIINQPNSGVSTARNNGAKLAKYDFVAFLDADDWWHKDFLQEMHNLIIQCPEAGLYSSSYYVVKNKQERGACIGVDENFETGYIDYFDVYARTFWVPINCSFVVVKKTVFDKEHGFKPTIKFGEDFDLWVRIALKNKIAYVNKRLAYSNQDVDLHNRALNSNRLWRKEEHIIFNIGYLEKQENITLKSLLDGLRVRSLMAYHLQGKYTDDVNRILKLINWDTQPFLYRFIYTWPTILVKIYFALKLLGSTAKTFLLINLIKYNNSANVN